MTLELSGAQQGVVTTRRYYLLKAQFYAQTTEGMGMACAYLGKQAAVAGTPLPPDTPALSALAAAHYTTIEDMTGATVDELVGQGLTRQQATAALQALAIPDTWESAGD